MTSTPPPARGTLEGLLLPPAATTDGQDAVIAERTGTPPTASGPVATPSTPNPFAYWTIADLVENPPPPLVSLIGLAGDHDGLGLIVAGSVSLIHAKPGSHKSWLALLIARAVASGQPLFGVHHVPTPGRVLYLDFETGRSLWDARWHALDREEPVDAATRQRLAVMTRDREPAMALNTTAAIERMIDAVRMLDPDLIVVDTLANAAGGDENDARAMATFMDAIRLVSRARPNPDTPAAVVVIHHNNKIGTDYRGSTAIDGALDDRWELAAEGDVLELRHRKARMRQALPAVGWRLDSLPGGGVRGVHEAVKRTRKPTDTEREEHRVLDILRAMAADGETATARSVAARFRADYIDPDGDRQPSRTDIDATRRVLNRLVDADRVFTVTPGGAKKRGRVDLEYRVNTTITAG